jgi:hypothetical protein
MTVDLTKILESKRALRRELAARPVAEKLRMLEVMRERDMAILRRIQADSPSRSTPG